MKKVRRILLSFLFRISHLIKSDKLFLTIAYFLWTGHVLHWSHPKRFTEKIQWLKLYSIKPEYTRLVDKYEVKSIVQNIIGYQFVIPTIAVYDSVEDIDVDSLPMQFVMKTTNGGGGNNVLVCKNKADLDINLMKQKMTYSLSHKENSTNNFRERQYEGIVPKIIIEPYLQNGDDYELTDYKFFCFNEKALYCQVISNRRSKETIDFYDRLWRHMPFVGLNRKCVNANTIHQKPVNYEEMLSIADKLACGFHFVRIDLYSVNGKTFFGEYTFFPGSGFGAFTPDEWDYKLGDKIKLPKLV